MFKTKFYSFLMVLMLVVTSVGFSACSSDDDSPSSGSLSIDFDGQTVKFSHAGYARYTNDSESGIDYKYDYAIMFTDFDFKKAYESGKLPKKINMFMIDVYGDGEDIPTGTFQPREYDLSLLVDWNYYTEEDGSYFEEYNYQSGPLTISKDGGKYTISLPKMALEGEVWKDGKQQDDVVIVSSFNYSGSLKFYGDIDDDY